MTVVTKVAVGFILFGLIVYGLALIKGGIRKPISSSNTTSVQSWPS